MNPQAPNQPQPPAPQQAVPQYAGNGYLPQPVVSPLTAAPAPQFAPAQLQQIPAQQFIPQQMAAQPQYQPQVIAPGQAPPVVSAAPSGAQPAPNARPAVKTNPNSTQNTLQIAEIRDGIVIMNDGSFRSVIMVKSINFDLMSPQEQEAVEYSFQGFLNSLYFPIQIFVRSQRVDLQPYIEKLDKIRTEHDNMLLALLMEDYITYIDRLSQQTNIMDKKFYVVVPFFPVPDVQKALTQSKNFFTGLAGIFKTRESHVTINEADLEKAKTELRNRVQSTLEGLMQCSIQGLPLDTQELIELYYDTYNPDTATRQQLKNFDELTADVIQKGQGTAVQAHLQRELQ